MTTHDDPSKVMHRTTILERFNQADCQHFDQINDVTPSADGCEDCLKTGDTWFELRLCMICGYVGCCDNSKNQHATKHYHSSGHPLIHPYGSLEEWLWCYIDEKMMLPY